MLLSSSLKVSILEGLHDRTENRLTKSASDPKLGEAALENKITANTNLNKSKTLSKNDQSVLRGQQQNTVFYKNNLWHKHTTENNWTVCRKWSKSQIHQESHQHNTAAKKHPLYSWPIHTRNLSVLLSVSLMSACVLSLVSGPMLQGRHGSAQAPKQEPREWLQVKQVKKMWLYLKNVNLLKVAGTVPSLNLK